MNHASLFSGIGGFDLAAEWMGWENVFNCEWDTYCQKILKQHFPDAEQYGDIAKTDFTKWKGTVDVLSGGFPCQPFSQAGKRKGTADDRYLWPEMLRAIREVQPTYIVGENVSGLITWNEGLVLEQVLSDLENEGYSAGAYVIPACAVNAPHRRDRIWIIAYASGKRHRGGNCQGCETKKRSVCQGKCKRGDLGGKDPGRDRKWTTADTNSHRLQRGDKKTERKIQSEQRFKAFNNAENWKDLPQPGVSGGNDGVPNRLDRTKALGNAIVPQVAYEIFKTFDRR